MKRRHFLGVAAAALAARWTRLSFADATVTGPATGVLRASLEQARVVGLPLLVLVIPESDEAKYERGQAFGELIQHGTAAELSPLSGAVLACGPMSELRALAKGLPAGEPWMVALDRDGRFEIIDGVVPKKVQRIEQHIDPLSKVLWNAKMLARSRAQSWSDLGMAVKHKLMAAPPPGSHWATHSMCGFEHVEGLKSPDDDKIAMDCGMGSISERSSKFLYFWTRTPEQRYLDRQGRKT